MFFFEGVNRTNKSLRALYSTLNLFTYEYRVSKQISYQGP